MNSLIIFPEELTGSIARISGKHLSYLRELHDLKVGRKLPVNLWKQSLGYGEILEDKNSELIVSFTPGLSPLPLNPVILIVAVPRPQTQKKVIHLAASLGLAAVHFVRCENTEKSYLSSKSLSPENIQWEIVKGLEQSGDPNPPQIEVHQRFKTFIEDIAPGIISNCGSKIIFDTVPDNCQSARKLETPAVFAFGPEAGWNDFEREKFKGLGFSAASLGPRILRCETAVALALGKILPTS
jgi:RsmE family RNA methyltransferase